MQESDESVASKPDESTEDAEEFPHLARVGLKIDIDSISKALSDKPDLAAVLPRSSDNVTITNGMIADACKILCLVRPAGKKKHQMKCYFHSSAISYLLPQLTLYPSQFHIK